MNAKIKTKESGGQGLVMGDEDGLWVGDAVGVEEGLGEVGLPAMIVSTMALTATIWEPDLVA